MCGDALEMVPEWDKVRGMFRAARRQEEPRGKSWACHGNDVGLLSCQGSTAARKETGARKALALQNHHENNF